MSRLGIGERRHTDHASGKAHNWRGGGGGGNWGTGARRRRGKGLRLGSRVCGSVAIVEGTYWSLLRQSEKGQQVEAVLSLDKPLQPLTTHENGNCKDSSHPQFCDAHTIFLMCKFNKKIKKRTGNVFPQHSPYANHLQTFNRKVQQKNTSTG